MKQSSSGSFLTIDAFLGLTLWRPFGPLVLLETVYGPKRALVITPNA